MPSESFDVRAESLLAQLRDSGQTKAFYEVEGPLGATARVRGRGEVVVLCSNNYLGLADHPEVIQAGVDGLKKYGAGTASVRFICGTLVCHRELETTMAQLVGTPAALTYVSCWTANEAVFPTLTAPGDAILSDELNHASIIDACRLANKEVQRAVFRHNDLDDLEAKLKASTATGTHGRASGARWVVVDGVFSMEGDLCPLDDLVDLCRKYDAMLVVDDSHGIGVVGRTGRGTPEHFGQLGRIDVLTGTLGKALGGAAGGYVAASERAIAVLEQRARTSLFSNALPATVACSARKAIEILLAEPERVARLRSNVARIRGGLSGLGFELHDSPTAIVPIMIGDEAEAIRKSARLMELGVMAIGFAFPVVPRGKARIRVQVSAALEDAHIDRVLDAFAKL